MTDIGGSQTLTDAMSLAAYTADWMSAAVLAADGPCPVSLSGGSIPKARCALLASKGFRSRFPWQRVYRYWADEYFVPYDPPDSNYRRARGTTLSKVPVPSQNVHPVPADGKSDAAARRYERTLQGAYGGTHLDLAQPLFEATLRGLGADGHAASLLPSEPLREERERWVGPVSHGRPEVHVTPTDLAIESSRGVACLVSGREWAKIFSAIPGGNSHVPAARAGRGVLWFLHRDTAGE
jgi:6-phosphogluconolactonase